MIFSYYFSFKGHFYLLEIPLKTVLLEFSRPESCGKAFSSEESAWVHFCCQEVENAGFQINQLKANSGKEKQMNDFLIGVVKSVFMEMISMV